MKTITFLSILFCVITLPALGALTDTDLDKIRLIVNDAEKRIKAEVKAEISSVKQDLKTDIASIKQEVKEDIAKSEENLKERIRDLTHVVYALIALIVAAIAIPQLIMAWRSAREQSLARQVEILT